MQRARRIALKLLHAEPPRHIPRRRVIAEHMVWDKQDFFVGASKEFGWIAGIPDIRLFFLQSALRSLDDLPGAVAECGVRNGKSTHYMHASSTVPRQFFLFDSFEGLSDPTEGKDSLRSAVSPKTGKRLFSLEDKQEVISRLTALGPEIHILEGWIPERFTEVSQETFCLVHIDVDLYRPTLDSLEFFFQRLVPGGIIVCDDYGSGHYPGARAAMDEFFSNKLERIIEIPQGQGFIVKRSGE